MGIGCETPGMVFLRCHVCHRESEMTVTHLEKVYCRDCWDDFVDSVPSNYFEINEETITTKY